MGRLHPEFYEPVTENILNFFEELTHNIEENPNIDPNELVVEFIEKYESKRKSINNVFSNHLINDVKYIIKKILKANEEFLKEVLDKHKARLIDCCINYFIEHYTDFYPNIEIKDEDEYIRMHHAPLINALNQLKSSQNSMIKIKKWLITQLKEDWNLIESIWNDLNQDSITTFNFLKNAFEILGEKRFYRLIIYSPEIQKILKKIVR